jgi:hypothetical protein
MIADKALKSKQSKNVSVKIFLIKKVYIRFFYVILKLYNKRGMLFFERLMGKLDSYEGRIKEPAC